MRPPLSTSDAGTNRPAIVFAAALCVAFVALIVRHAGRYFFLIDDYALIGESLGTPAGAIVGQPLFGFYRPVTFLFVRLETLAYAWSAPWAFATTSAGLHAANAALVRVLACRVTRDRAAGWFAGGLFLASPWAAEAFLWTSGRFDLLAAAGVLSALVIASWASESRGRRWTLAVPPVFLVTLLAVGAKEHAAALPAAVAGLAVLFATTQDARRRLAVMAGTSAAAVGAYLVVRQRVLPGMGGAYGGWTELMSQVDVVGALVGFVRAYVAWPLPARDPRQGLAEALLLTPVLAIAIPALLWNARRQWRSIAGCLILGLASLGPTLWAPASGRFLYLPGAWLAVAAGLCLSAWTRAGNVPSRVARMGTHALPVLLALYAVVSLETQAGWWQMASASARAGVTSFAQWVDRDIAAVHITNLPFRCVEGPTVLTSYAFVHYYQGRQVPAIRSTAHMVRCEGDDAEGLPGFPDPLAAIQSPQPGEQDVSLATRAQVP